MEQTTDHTVVFVLSVRKAGTTFEQYKTYYETKHAPLVAGLVFHGDLRPLSFTRNYIRRDTTATSHSDSAGESKGQSQAIAPSFPFGGTEGWEYDCITRVVFRDAAHRDALFQEFSKHQDKIAADEDNFMEKGKLRIVFVDESPSNVRKD